MRAAMEKTATAKPAVLPAPDMPRKADDSE
jgi:hypothetical protein